MKEKNVLLEIEDNKGNTIYLINLSIKDNKVSKVIIDEDKLSFADIEENDKFQHLRIQEVDKDEK